MGLSGCARRIRLRRRQAHAAGSEEGTMDAAARATQAEIGKRSRKGLIAGALALLGAGALVEAKPARAGTDGDVVLGADNGPVANRTAVRTANWREFAVLADPNNDGNPYGSIGAWGHGS